MKFQSCHTATVPPLHPPLVAQELESESAALQEKVNVRVNMWAAGHGGDKREPSIFIRDLSDKISSTNMEKARCEGQLSMTEKEVARLTAEMRKPDVASADQKHRELLVKKTVHDLACKVG